MRYVPRIVDDEIRELLGVSGAIVLDGPRACGKTETARQHAASEVLLDTDSNAADAIALDPAILLEGATPRLIDEWQTYPVIWNHVRRKVDDRRAPGQFLLTGSATPVDDRTRHSGAGRFTRVHMRPMTLTELGRSTAAISLGALLNGESGRSVEPGLSLDELIAEIVRGGWPGLLGAEPMRASRQIRDDLERIARTDIVSVDGVRRDPLRVSAVIESLARHVSTQATFTSIAKDVSGGRIGVSNETVADYVDALTRLMVVEDQPAWNTHLRSSHRLRTTPTRHFVDPSLAVAALQATPASLKGDLKTLGLLFEELVIRDLRVYSQAVGGRVFHYRDQTGLEVDAVVDLGATWGAFEIKLGTGQVEQAADSLLRFANRVDTSRRGAPAVLAVVCGSGYGIRRADGVQVIPIGALGP